MRITVPLLSLGLLVACTPAPRKPEQTSAIDRIAVARCDRAAACAGRRIEQSCEPRLYQKTVSDVPLALCRSSLDDDAVAACVARIVQEPCAYDLEDVTKIDECSVRAFCDTGPLPGTL